MILARMLLPSNIKIDRLEHVEEILPSLEDREYSNAAKGTDKPHDTDDDPSGEELLREDVAGSIHGHWPEDEQGESKDDGHGFGDLGGAQELGLLDGHFVGGLVALAGDGFEILACLGGHVVVVGLADCGHGSPVVLIDAEDECEDGSER